MEQTLQTKVLLLRERIQQQQEKYAKALADDKEFSEVKEIKSGINRLQKQLKGLLPQKKRDYERA